MGNTKFVVIKLKELIKTAIFAVLGVIILVGLIWFFLSLGDSDSATYRDGTYYTQVAFGQENAVVSVKVADGKIADVALSELSETVAVFYPVMETAVAEVKKEVVKNQSLEIQVSKDNAYSAQKIIEAVEKGLAQAKK